MAINRVMATFPRTTADQGWLKPLSHIQKLPPNTSRSRLAEAPVTHSEPSPKHQPTKNLPPNTSRPRLAEAPVTHSEPSPEHQPTKNLPPNTSRPRLAEAPVTHSEPSPEHHPTKGTLQYPFSPELSGESRVKCVSQGHKIGGMSGLEPEHSDESNLTPEHQASTSQA
ncbi:hypothetical protein Bbelb_141850 [Branchiostoma belcheri]|nr:hypothetical protein Bbelb_141850 [Branchiostoma belcheri]